MSTPVKYAAESRSPNSHYEYYHTANQIRKLMEARAAFLQRRFFLPRVWFYLHLYGSLATYHVLLLLMLFAIQVPNSTNTPLFDCLAVTALVARFWTLLKYGGRPITIK